METPKRRGVGGTLGGRERGLPEDREVPDDLRRWRTADELAALLWRRYRFVLAYDPLAATDSGKSRPGGWANARPCLLGRMARAVTFPHDRPCVDWRVSRLRTRGEGRQLEAWVRLRGRDDRGKAVEVPVELRRMPEGEGDD